MAGIGRPEQVFHSLRLADLGHAGLLGDQGRETVGFPHNPGADRLLP